MQLNEANLECISDFILSQSINEPVWIGNWNSYNSYGSNSAVLMASRVNGLRVEERPSADGSRKLAVCEKLV